METYELIKDIERYGQRIHEVELDKHSKVFVYQYENKVYIISKHRGEVLSLLRASSVYVEY